MRIAFLGNDPWSVPPLEALAAAPGVEIAVVVTNPPRPAGRGSALTPTAVAEAARRLGLPLVEAEGVRDGPGRAALEAAELGALVVVAYGEILTARVLAIAPLGALNLHFSLLPRWRGASPVQRALLAGDAVTGVTVMGMDEGLDTGPVLAAVEDPIRDDDDAGALGTRLAELGSALLVRTLADLEAGRVRPEPQDDAHATYAGKLTAADRGIDWREPDVAVLRRIRALAPSPGATTAFRGQPFKVLSARGIDFVPGRSGEERMPGAIAWEDGWPGPLVQTSDGTVLLLAVAPAGRRRMPAADWARGARLEHGERLG